MSLPAAGFYAGAYCDQNYEIPKLPWPDTTKLKLNKEAAENKNSRQTSASSPSSYSATASNRDEMVSFKPTVQPAKKLTDDDGWWK
jgi:hypothetical protein